MLKVSLKLRSVPFQRPCARSSEGLSMAEKTAAPHSRYTTMRRASSAKRPLSSLRCRERQPCKRWAGIVQISAPLAHWTATRSTSETAVTPLQMPPGSPPSCSLTALQLPPVYPPCCPMAVFWSATCGEKTPHLWRVCSSWETSWEKVRAHRFMIHFLSHSCASAAGV